MKRENAPAGLCVSDAETTGVDIAQDRIITFYAMITNIKGEVLREQSWTIDPGVEVPQGASDVHGMTTEWVRENGRKDTAEAIQEIAMFHIDAIAEGFPVVGFNHSFDLGMLNHELIRHFGEGLETTVEFREAHYFDPLIYDRATDKYRRGKRKLMDVARHWGIEIDETKLHDAQYDVEITSKTAWRMLQKSPYTLKQMQSLQKQWKKEWAKHLTEYFHSIGQTENDGSKIIVDGSFPWSTSNQ